MANNGGRQGGAGGNQGMNEHVEFTVKVRCYRNREVWHCHHSMDAITCPLLRWIAIFHAICYEIKTSIELLHPAHRLF